MQERKRNTIFHELLTMLVASHYMTHIMGKSCGRKSPWEVQVCYQNLQNYLQYTLNYNRKCLHFYLMLHPFDTMNTLKFQT